MKGVEIDEFEINSLPLPLRQKVINLVEDYAQSKEFQTLFQRQKVETEQDIFEIREKLDANLKQSEILSKENTLLKSRLKDIENDRDDRNRRLVDAQTLYETALVEKNDCQRKCDLLLREKNDLSDILDRRKVELEESKTQSSKLEEQVKSLLLEKCKAQIQLDEIKSKELAVEHRENRWTQEKELMEQEKLWYMEEISRRDQQIFSLRRDMGLKELEQETFLSKKDESLNQMKISSEELKSQVQLLTNQIDELNGKLKEAADESVNIRETFEKELQCQLQLAEVYKQSASEAESKVEELTAALDGVKQLYSEAKESHFAMQEQIRSMQSSHQAELEKHGHEILELKDELEKANELLRSKHRVMLTDEEVAALSPGAAAASRLIKSGISLTQIYRDHCKIVEELEQQKFENKRLESYIKEMVEDITKKAPILKQQRDDYYETLEVVQRLKVQLNEVGCEQEKLLTEKDGALRQLTYTKAELERFQRDNADLSAQVRQLLQCLEKTRRGDTDSGLLYGSAPSDPLPSAEDLVLFRDIDELQSQNQRLLSALREAEAKREEMVKAAQEAEMSKVKSELENALSELNALQDHREKQNLVLDTVSNQRDTYKRICDEMRAKLAANSDNSMVGDEEQESRKSNQALLDQLNKEFDTYRKEKCETERLLNSKIDELTKQVSELQSSNVKLNAEIEYQEQRFKILAGNTEGYKKELKLLRERLETSGSTVGKHEQKIAELTVELVENQEKLARMKTENRSFEERLQCSKSNEQRLLQELSTMKSNSHSHEMLIASLQQLQSRLDSSEAEKTHRVRESLDAMTRERNNLQHTLNTVMEQEQQYVAESKAKLNDLETKLEAESVKNRSLESKLEWEEKCRRETDEKSLALQAQLEAYSSGGKDASLERFQKEAQQLQTRLNYLEIQYQDAKRKLEDANEKLKRTEGEIANYKRVAESMENSIKNQEEASVFARKQLEDQVAASENRLEVSRRTIKELTEEKDRDALFLDGLKGEYAQKETEAAAKIERLEQQLNHAKLEVDEWKKKEMQASADRDCQAQKAAETEGKLWAEMEVSKENSSKLELAQVEIKDLGSKVNAAITQMNTLKDELSNSKSLMEAKETELSNEINRLVQRESELENSRTSLYEQVEKLGKQVAVLERHRESSSNEDFDSTSADGRNAETASSLSEVITYLRAELQDARTTGERADGERKKLENREKQLEVQLQKIKDELENSRREAAAVIEIEKEKAQLISQLKVLEDVQQSSRELVEEKRRLECALNDAKQQFSILENNLTRANAEKLSVENRLVFSQRETAALKNELDSWKDRHHKLVEQRASFESEQMNKLRTELEENAQKRKEDHVHIQKMELQLQELQGEHIKLQAQLQDVSEEKDSTMSQLQDVRENLDRLNGEYTQQAKILTQARRYALKYKKDCELLKQQQSGSSSTKVPVEEKEVETEPVETEKELTELKEKCQGLENTCKELEAKCAALEKEKSSGKVPSSLLATINDMQKEQEGFKHSLESSGKQLIIARRENRELQDKVAKLEKEKQAAESAEEEKQFRLDALVNLHSQCEVKIQKLNDQIKALKEEKTAEKPSAIVQQQQQPPVIQPVAALTSADRGASNEQRSSFRTGRSIPLKTASIRPMSSAQRTTQSSMLPPAVSPGPAQPDQSSNSSGVASAAVTPIVSTTQQPSTTSVVPHAVVMPHIEPQQETVSASSDSIGFAISSSTAAAHPSGISSSSNAGGRVVTIETGPEASTSSVDSSRKRPVAPCSGGDVRYVKRPRPDSSAQVSTSDELGVEEEGRDKEIDADVIVEGAVEPYDVDDEEESDEEEVEVEGLGEDEEEEEEEEEESGDEAFEDVARQPESSLSDSDEVMVIDTVDNARYQPQPHSVPSHSSAMMGRGFPVMLEEGDESVVPSTPTLCAGQRPENEVSSAHVPQSQRFFEPNFLPLSSNEATVAEESGIQQNVPGTPGQGSPPQVSLDSDSGGAATSTVNVGELGMERENFDFDHHAAEFLPREASEEPQPHDSSETDEIHSYESHDVQQESEAIPVTGVQDEQPGAPSLDEPNEPSTSQPQQKQIKLRKPIEWPSSGEPSSSNRGRIRERQTARRSRGIFQRGSLSRGTRGTQ